MNHTILTKVKQLLTKILLVLGVLFFLKHPLLLGANPSENNSQTQESSNKPAKNTLILIFKNHPVALISSMLGTVLVGVGIIIGIRYIQSKTIQAGNNTTPDPANTNHNNDNITTRTNLIRPNTNIITQLQQKHNQLDTNTIISDKSHNLNTTSIPAASNHNNNSSQIIQDNEINNRIKKNKGNQNGNNLNSERHNVKRVKALQEAKQLINLTSSQEFKGTEAEAMKEYEKAKKIVEDVFGSDHLAYARTIYYIGNKLFNNKKQYIQARKFYQKALPIFKNHLHKDSKSYGIIHYNIANTYIRKEKYDIALRFIKKNLGEKHPTYAEVLNEIGIYFYRNKKYPKARKYFKQALPLYQKNLRQQDPQYPTLVENLANTYILGSKYEKAIQTVQNNLEDQPLVYAETLNQIGRHLYKNKQYIDARKYFEKALPLYQKNLGVKHEYYADVVYNIAGTHIVEKEYKTALHIVKKKLGEKHLTYAEVLNKIDKLQKSE